MGVWVTQSILVWSKSYETIGELPDEHQKILIRHFDPGIRGEFGSRRSHLCQPAPCFQQPARPRSYLSRTRPRNCPTPTIHLSVNHGYVGQSVLVSGNVPSAAYTGVRVSWVISDTTYTAAVVNRDATLAYQATTGVPHTLVTGSAKVCAALTGTAIAEFACQDFTLDPAPLGSVTGTIPLAVMTNGAAGRAGAPVAPINATANLMDRGGNILYSGPVGSNGSFSIANVASGIYQVAVTGSLNQPVGPGIVTVNPGLATQVGLQAHIILLNDPVTGQPCSGNFSAQVSAVNNTTTSNNYINQIEYLPLITACQMS